MMGKRALRSGELVAVHQSVQVGALMFADPEDKVKGAPVGRFTFGVYMASMRGPEPTNVSHFITYVYVLDSASMRAGWCLAKLIRRPSEPEDR